MSYGIDIKTEVQGLADLEKMLLDLLPKDAKRSLGKAARESMKPVQEKISQTAGYDDQADDNHMRENVKMNTKYGDKKEAKNTAVTVRVGFKGIHAQKAIAQEYGTEKQQAAPFMREAFLNNREATIQTFKDILADQINRTQRKYARQARRAARDA